MKPTRQELEEKKGFWKRLGICMTIGFVIVSILWNVFDANLRSQNTNLQSQLTELKQNCNINGSYNLLVECDFSYKEIGTYIYRVNDTFSNYTKYQKELSWYKSLPSCEVIPQ